MKSPDESAAARAGAVRALADRDTTARGLCRRSHVFPLRAKRNGAFERAGGTTAATDLPELAGQRRVGVIIELVDDDRVPPRDQGVHQSDLSGGSPCDETK